MEDGRAREKEQLVLLSQLRRNRKPLIKGEGYPNVKEESSSVTEKMAKSNGETVMETILIHPEVNSWFHLNPSPLCLLVKGRFLSRIKRENMGNLLFQVTRVCHRPGEFWIFLDLRNLPNISSAQITGSSGCKLSEIIYVHILWVIIRTLKR